MRRAVFAAYGTALVVAVTVTALTSPASAAPTTTHTTRPISTLERSAAATVETRQGVNPDSLSDCPSHTLCLWNYSNFTGTIWRFPLSTFGYNTWYYVGSSANDKATSVYSNRGYCTLVAKDSPPRSPNIVELQPGEAINNLRYYSWPDGSNANNSISAFALLNYCS